MKATGKIALGRTLEVVLGRRELYRLGRFLSNYSRLDFQNDIETNGELYVQDVALEGAGASPLICLDVGANIGAWSMALMKRARLKRIPIDLHSFEPCAETFAALTRNLAGITTVGRCFTIKKACSDRIGRATLNVVHSGCCGINSIVAESRFPVEATEDVELTTIDTYCGLAEVGVVRLLKIDAEGHDLAVIRGANGMLSRRAIDILQFEYNQRWIDSRAFLRDAFDTFTTYGYRVGKVTSRGVEFYSKWSSELETFVEGNYVACTAVWLERFRHVQPEWLSQVPRHS